MNLRAQALLAAIFALVLLMPSVARADPYQDFERIVGSLQELGYIEQAADLQASLEQVPEAQFRAVAGEVNVAALAAAFEDAVPAAKKLWAVEHQFSSRRSAGSEAYDPDEIPSSDVACPRYPHFEKTTADTTLAWEDWVEVNTGLRAAWNVANAFLQVARLGCLQLIVVATNGANTAPVCIPFAIAESVAKALLDASDDGARIVYADSVRSARCNARLTGAWVEGNNTELQSLKELFSDTSTELTGQFAKLATHFHGDEGQVTEIASGIETIDAHLRDLKGEVDDKLTKLEEDIDKALKIVKAQGLSRYGGSRWDDGYYGEGGLAKLNEACDQAQAALDRASISYQVGPRVQTLISRGRQLISPELESHSRRNGFELCRIAYRLATEKSFKPSPAGAGD